jgi:putative oxidoreductase
MDKATILRLFQPAPQTTAASAALALLRVVAGTGMILHGWGKIQSPMSWMGPDASVPGIFQFLAALSEFGGGIAWIIGLVVPLASFGTLSTMVVATYMHAVVNGDPFVGKGGPSYELALLYLVISLLFIAVGPGKFSADAKIFGLRS